jgi:C-terminal processing protease CtpA/Prc
MSSYSSINHAYNSGAEVLNIRLKRPNNTVSWGFNIQGGKEFSSPLLIQKITPNSLADRCSLKPGDYIIRIGNRSVENFTHNDARNSIIEQGNDLEIVIQRYTNYECVVLN